VHIFFKSAIAFPIPEWQEDGSKDSIEMYVTVWQRYFINIFVA